MLFRNSHRSQDAASENGDGRLPTSKAMSITKLVDRLGFGPAQLRAVGLGSFAMFFCDGSELALLPLISTSTSSTFGLGPYQEALMLTIALFGLMIGNVFSGFVGDTLGRRPAILMSLGTTALLGYASSLAMDYPSLILSRCLLGIGMGLGMGPSMVRVSENCPEKYRIFCQGLRSFGASCAGPLLVALLAGLDDPYLQELNWKRMIVIVAAFPAFFSVAGFFFLSESPVWLACTGHHSAARAGFAEVREQNSAHGVDVNYEQPSIVVQEHLGTVEQLRIVFSRSSWRMTCSLMSISFLLNLMCFGDSYGLAHILPDISYIPAAWQISMRQTFSALWIVFAIMIVNSMSRKNATIVGLLGITVGACAFAFGGAADMPRSVGREAFFQFGTNMLSFAVQMLFVAVFQFSVEIYPPNASSTGCAVVVATGRAGAIAAPMVFEHLRFTSGWWGTFYIFVGMLTLVTACAFSFVSDVKPYRPGESDFGILGEVKKLEDPATMFKYGAASEALSDAGPGQKGF